MTNKKDPHAELMALADSFATTKPGGLAVTRREALDAFARTLTDRIAELEAELARPETTAVSLMHAELMRLAEDFATVKFVEGIDGNEGRVETALHILDAYARTLTDRIERAERMFGAACADLGAINEALGLDPDDGGAEPIIDAIKEMQSCVGDGGVSIEGLVMHVTKSAEQHAKESAEYMEMLNKYLPVVGLFAADHEGYKGHDSDCSVHNEPAFPAGPCDCRLAKAAPQPQQIAEPASQFDAGYFYNSVMHALMDVDAQHGGCKYRLQEIAKELSALAFATPKEPS